LKQITAVFPQPWGIIKREKKAAAARASRRLGEAGPGSPPRPAVPTRAPPGRGNRAALSTGDLTQVPT